MVFKNMYLAMLHHKRRYKQKKKASQANLLTHL